MAMSVTEYGLVKNDDGSMCFTIRPDDTPFPGVCSLALEESTTNAFANVLFEDGTTAWGTTGFQDNTQLTVLEKQGLYNLNAMKVERIDGSGTGTGATIAQSKGNWANPFTLTQGEKMTVSWYVKGVGNTIGKNVRAHCYATDGTNTISTGTIYTLTSEWQRITHTLEWTYDTEATNLVGHARVEDIEIGDYFLVCMPQIEKKEFATSFVDGSRPKGWFYVPLESLGFDPATDDWVIAYWKKPIATSTGDLTGLNIMSIGRYTNDYSVGYVYWGKRYNGDRFRVHAVQSDGSGVGSEVSLDPSTYFNQWHFEVVLRVGNEIKYYYDGQLKVSLTITDLQTFDRGLYVQGYATDVCNSLYANVLYGKAKDSSGNLVWTDSYIQEVYNARAPFAK